MAVVGELPRLLLDTRVIPSCRLNDVPTTAHLGFRLDLRLFRFCACDVCWLAAAVWLPLKVINPTTTIRRMNHVLTCPYYL